MCDDHPGYCPWCDGRVTAMTVMGVPGYVSGFWCEDCGANEMTCDERKSPRASAEERNIGWWRPEPEYCPHNWKDEGIMKAEYICQYCLSKMEDFK